MEKRKKFILEFTFFGFLGGLLPFILTTSIIIGARDYINNEEILFLTLSLSGLIYGLLTLRPLKRFLKIKFLISYSWVILSSLSFLIALFVVTGTLVGRYSFLENIFLKYFFLLGMLPALLLTLGLFFILTQNNLKFKLGRVLIVISLMSTLPLLWFGFTSFINIFDFIGPLRIIFIYPTLINFLLGWSIDWNGNKENIITEK